MPFDLKRYFHTFKPGSSLCARQSTIKSLATLAQRFALFVGLTALSACAYSETGQTGRAAQDDQALLLGVGKPENAYCDGELNKLTKTARGEVWSYQQGFHRDSSTDSNSIDFTEMRFSGDEVLDVTYRKNQTVNTFGIRFPQGTIASMTSPDFVYC